MIWYVMIYMRFETWYDNDTILRREKVRNAKQTEKSPRNSGRTDQEKETPVVWTCGSDGGRKTTNRGFTWTCGGKEKQRETEEDLDGQRQGKPERENIDLTRIGETTRNREVWRNIIKASSSAR